MGDVYELSTTLRQRGADKSAVSDMIEQYKALSAQGVEARLSFSVQSVENEEALSFSLSTTPANQFSGHLPLPPSFVSS